LVKMSGEDSSAHAGLEIGRTLELARKERGLSLKQVEQATKIRARYLRELERENFDVLPAVYVQGSLKTYANFLHLDGEALTRELRRRQTSWHEPQDPADAEPPKDDYFDRSPVLLGGRRYAKSQEITEDEEDARAASIPAGGYLIYVGSAAFLVLVLVAIALALTLLGDSQPAVSQVREPLISQAPSQVSRVVSEENDRVRPQQEDDEESTDAESDSRQPEQRAGSLGEDGGGLAQTGQDQGGDQLAQDPPDATATPSASPTAQKEPAAAEPDAASTPPAEAPDQGNATGAPVRRSPQPERRSFADERPRHRGAQEHPPGSRAGGDFNVQIVPGSEDLVRITGDPVNDLGH
jgi:cytoskeletal protein RodZ